MLRQLLTLLAVFAGLTAAVEPARALETGVETVRLSEAVAPCGVVARTMPLQLRARVDEREAGKPCQRPAPVLQLAPVEVPVDRARE